MSYDGTPMYYYSTDVAGNPEGIRTIDTKYDPTPPWVTTAADVLTSVRTNKSKVTVALTSGDDGVGRSGVAWHYVSWTRDQPGQPDVYTAGTTSPVHSQSLADGTWYFNVRVQDVAGNLSGTVSKGPFVIDTSSPTLTSIPAPNAEGVDPQVVPQVTFSEPMDNATVPGSMVLEADNGPLLGWRTVKGTQNYSLSTRTLTMFPDSALTPGAHYRMRVQGPRDVAGNTLQPFVCDFYTGQPPAVDRTPPRTALKLDPETSNGKNGWYVTNPTAVLQVSEAAQTLYLVLDRQADIVPGDPRFASYTPGSKLPEFPAGVSYVYFYSVDTAANVEPVRQEAVKVDEAAPWMVDTYPKNNQVAPGCGYFIGAWFECSEPPAAWEITCKRWNGTGWVDLGTVESVLDGSRLHIPRGFLTGRYSLDVKLSDEAGNTSIGTVVISVNPCPN